MVKSDPLAALKDIHLPDAIGWWPLAPGWYLFLLLVLVLLVVAGYWLYQKHCHAIAKKQALRLLAQYQKQFAQQQNTSLTSAQISELLRRVALVYFPREQVASLHGEAWLDFLNRTGRGVNFYLVKDILLEAPFKNNTTSPLQPLFHLSQLWIKQRGKPCSN